MEGLAVRPFVTGASGYIGGYLTARLVADGARPHVLLRPNATTDTLDSLGDRITRHVYDGSDGQLAAILEAARPDVVFHLASLFHAEHRPQDIEPLVRANVLLGAQLLDAMAVAGVARIVNTGTAWQHFNDADFDPVCLYAATKQAFEAILAFYVNAHQMRAITLALFDTYGPADPRPKLFNLLQQRIGRSEPLKMSPGEQLIDLVHVSDVVTAFTRAADLIMASTTQPGHAVHAVSSGAPIRLRDLVEMYEAVIGCPIPIEWGGRPYREREVMIPWRTGEPLPGWLPRIDLRSGLATLDTAHV